MTYETEPRKRPTQVRAMATFDALVQATELLLADVGYAAITTNAVAERAGVGIGSLYEYFPGKDAMVAVVAERLCARVMDRLTNHMDAIIATRPDNEMLCWLQRVHETLHAEQRLIVVFLMQVPFTYQLEVARNMVTTLHQFSDRAREAAGVSMAKPRESLLLINNLVASTMLQLVLAPPPDGVAEDMIETLAARVDDLIAADKR